MFISDDQPQVRDGFVATVHGRLLTGLLSCSALPYKSTLRQCRREAGSDRRQLRAAVANVRRAVKSNTPSRPPRHQTANSTYAVQAREIGNSMASLAAPSGGTDLELRVAADAASVRLMLAQVRDDANLPSVSSQGCTDPLQRSESVVCSGVKGVRWSKPSAAFVFG